MAKKARKWSNLDGQLPEEPKPLSEREVKIRVEVDKLRGMAVDNDTGELIPAKTMRELAADYAGLVEEESFEDLAQKKRSVKYEALERVIYDELRRVQELSGQDMWRGEGQTFSPKFSPIPVITDMAALEAWIEANGYEYLYTIDGGRLKNLVVEALDTDAAAAMSPAERAALKPGEAASGQPPPGVSVFLRKGVNRTETK